MAVTSPAPAAMTAPPAAAAARGPLPAPRPGIGAVLDVDLGAIVANWRLLGTLAGGRPTAAVVKADGYGLGAAPIAAALARAGCRQFFVAHLEEGVALRASLAEADIFVLHGVPAGGEAQMRASGLIPVLSTCGQIDLWRAEARRCGRLLPAALHVDTGMTRLGLDAREAGQAGAPGGLEGLDLRLVLSHLASAEEPDNPANARQLAAFEQLRARLPRAPASLANSSGVFLGRAYHFDLLRPGAALYGVAPRRGAPNPLAQPVRLSARVLRLADVPQGVAVGYNGRYVTPAPRRLATVCAGYADGFFRALAGRACAGFAGQRLPVVGAVSMDMVTVDVSALPEGRLREDDFIDLIGGDADGVDTLAAAASTIGYEILTALGRRYQRRWSGAPAQGAAGAEGHAP